MWPRVLNAILGTWLVASPHVRGYSGAGRTIDTIIGALAAAVAVMAMAEVLRSLRWINVALGAVLVAAPFLIGFSADAMTQRLIAGMLLVRLGLIKGRLDASFGGGWPAVWRRGE